MTAEEERFAKIKINTWFSDVVTSGRTVATKTAKTRRRTADEITS